MLIYYKVVFSFLKSSYNDLNFKKKGDALVKKRHNVENNIKKFYKMIKAGQVVFNCPIQRDDKQWSNMQQSKLIRAVLIDFSIPPVYSVAVTKETEQEMIYSIFDGQQRLTSFVEFIDGEYPLNIKIEDIEHEGEVYKIAGRYFLELPEELQDVIYDYSLQMVHYMFLTDDELAEMFDYLNSGSPLSRQQKAKAVIGMKTAQRLNELKHHPFIKVNASLSKNQHRRAEDEETLVQAMMLIDKDYVVESFSATNMNKYASQMKDGKEELMDKIEKIMDYIHRSLDDYTDTLVLKKTIIPILIEIGDVALNDNLPEHIFSEWVKDFKLAILNKGNIKIDYAEYMGAGSISKAKVFGRRRAAKRHYKTFTEGRV